jgi:hypothetical protein
MPPGHPLVVVSPITSDLIVSGTIGLEQALDGADIYSGRHGLPKPAVA